MADPARLEALFNKYLQRSCSRQELEELISLLYQAQAEHTLQSPMQDVWEQLKNDKTSHDVDWDAMYKNISSVDEPVRITGRRYIKPWKWYGIAASVLLVASMAVYWYTTKSPGKASKQEPVVTTVETRNREAMRQTIHLPDGSTVILNANSRLNYPAAFTGKTREVFLTGEGFFDIKHIPQQPFLVHTGKLITKVIGTAFNIKAYAAQDSIEVTVERGKVQVLKDNKSLAFISASQQISFSNKTEEYAEKVVDIKPVIAWKPGEIFFNDITMEEAAKQIEERFNTSIVFTNPAIKNCRVTATFSEDDLPDEILAVICAVSKANYSITDKKILISGKGCN